MKDWTSSPGRRSKVSERSKPKSDLAAFVSSAPVAIAMLNADFRYIAASVPWCEAFALDHATLSATAFPQGPGTSDDESQATLRRLIAGELSCAVGAVRAHGGRDAQWRHWRAWQWRERKNVVAVIALADDQAGAQTEVGSPTREGVDLELALDAAAAGTWAIDLASGEVKLDDRSRRLLGIAEPGAFALDELIGRVVEEDREAIKGMLDRLARDSTGARFDADFRVEGDLGQQRWIHSTGRAVRDSAGHAIRLSGLNIDIDSRRRDEEELEGRRAKFAAAFDAMSDAVFFCDLDGKVSEINPACAAFHRFRDSSECPTDLRDIERYLEVCDATGKLLPLDQWAVPKALRGERAVGVEFRLRRRDTGECWIGSYNYGPIRDSEGGIIGAVVVAHDITESKRLSAELRASRHALSRRAEELQLKSAQLRQLAIDVTLAEQEARRDLAALMHDHLQQTLYAAKLQHIASASGSDHRQQPAAPAHKLGKLLDEAIEVTRSLAAELHPTALETFGLPTALAELAARFEDAHGLTIESVLDESAEPGTSELRLIAFHAARELLFNVAKHAGVSSAKLELGLETHGRIRIVVSDDGVGGASPTRRTAGSQATGLGLSNLSGRLELLGGTLTIESAPGKGTRCTVTLPLMPGHTESQSKGVTVLIADDHTLVCEGLKDLLSECPGIRVAGTAADVPQLKAELSRLAPDVLLVDLAMAGIESGDALHELSIRSPNTQIIAMSTDERASSRRIAQDGGVAAYLARGTDLANLLERIRSTQKRA